MQETLIIIGGIFTVTLIIFHLLFWRLFNWPESLQGTNYVNRATIQVLNISITFIFVIFAYISFAHTQELLTTPLGRTLLFLISSLWLFRTLQQIIFYKFRHPASIGLTLFFLTGAFLYGLPLII